MTVLLCGTSGTGKSTLASLLASRLGITSVVSTDSIRHMMRSFSSEAQDPLLWGSTYQAGEFLQRMGGTAGEHTAGVGANLSLMCAQSLCIHVARSGWGARGFTCQL